MKSILLINTYRDFQNRPEWADDKRYKSHHRPRHKLSSGFQNIMPTQQNTHLHMAFSVNNPPLQRNSE